MSNPTVFSKMYQINLGKPITKSLAEGLLKRFILDIGKYVSSNGIILGHIKTLAKSSNENFFFLSLTRLDQVDVKRSAQWQTEDNNEFDCMQLDVNVLVFGYDDRVVTEVVNDALNTFTRNINCTASVLLE